jgi:hypothetical protein
VLREVERLSEALEGWGIWNGNITTDGRRRINKGIGGFLEHESGELRQLPNESVIEWVVGEEEGQARGNGGGLRGMGLSRITSRPVNVISLGLDIKDNDILPLPSPWHSLNVTLQLLEKLYDRMDEMERGGSIVNSTLVYRVRRKEDNLPTVAT